MKNPFKNIDSTPPREKIRARANSILDWPVEDLNKLASSKNLTVLDIYAIQLISQDVGLLQLPQVKRGKK